MCMCCVYFYLRLSPSFFLSSSGAAAIHQPDTCHTHPSSFSAAAAARSKHASSENKERNKRMNK